MKYVNMRRTVDAFQLGHEETPPWWNDAEDNGDVRRTADSGFEVETGGGEYVLAKEGDWIVKYSSDEVVVVLDSVFLDRYERVE